jgi:hypothetical protein
MGGGMGSREVIFRENPATIAALNNMTNQYNSLNKQLL